MAAEVRLTPPAYPPVPDHHPASDRTPPALRARSGALERLGNALPLLGSLFIASSVFWAPWHPVTALVFATALVAFYGYWTVRSYLVAIACLVGVRRLRAWQRIDWRARLDSARAERPGLEPWDWPRHLVVIPNYREDEEQLARTLDSLAAQDIAGQLVVVLAMEQREVDARAKASKLVLRYRRTFADMFATYHPSGIPGEAPGKGSNEAWAARSAYERLIVAEGDTLERYTVTSCDADAVFHHRHFEALNYLFLTSDDRYHAFWQPAIFNSNNIWDVPAPLRLPDGLSGVNRLSNLVLPGRVKFPTSCYSLTWWMLHEVDYWDEEVIPEDWHLYLKSSYTLGDRVHVEPLYLPLGNDCVLTDGYVATLRAHYRQAVRHAWGVSDVPYAWRATWRGGPLGVWRRLFIAASVTKTHLLWMAQWYLITLGVLVPMQLAQRAGAPLPEWWTQRTFRVPGPGWHPENITSPGTWLSFDGRGLIEPTMWLNICGVLIAACILPLLVLIAIELRARGPRPPHLSRPAYIAQFGMWPLMAVITFFWASLPSLHAQIRLALGRGLVYRVAEKKSRAPAVSTLAKIIPLPTAPTEAHTVTGRAVRAWTSGPTLPLL